VPQIVKKQQLRDGGLVASYDTRRGKGGGLLGYSDSWSAEHIQNKWLALLFPHVWKYLIETYRPLEDGEYYCIPLVAHRGRLTEFVKKDPITGSDLETIKTGKGKKVEDKTLYFGQ
jgi:hypothetical protein